MIFISHDLTVINKIADRVVVMKMVSLLNKGHVNQSCIIQNMFIRSIYYQRRRRLMIILNM